MKTDIKQQKKPITFVKGKYKFYGDNKFQQNLLLQALQITTDPNRLKEMIGVKTVAEVYRTLDKIAIRKEYHEALLRHGIDLDTIVMGIKKVCTDSKSDAIQLRGYQTLLKSLGLDRYEDIPKDSAKSWEDLVMKQLEKEEREKEALPEGKTSEVVEGEYEVIQPKVPEGEEKKREEEREEGRNLYE